MATIIDGKQVAAEVKARVAKETKRLGDELGITPGLAVIIVGNDPASKIYVSNKKKACDEVGFYSEVIRKPEKTTQRELLEIIDTLNKRVDIDGILVQLPLPKHISEKAVISAISPKKDVDAFSPFNVGKVMIGESVFLPCTPAGVMELIKSTGVEVSGKNCVVIGRSNIVGKPTALLLLQQNATVTICHSKTQNLAEVCSKADILVSAVGKPNFVTADMVKEGAVVIDVGINHNEDGKLCGDVKFDEVEPKAGFITPVPGGVGPMTIAMLMENTLKATILKEKSSAKKTAKKQ